MQKSIQIGATQTSSSIPAVVAPDAPATSPEISVRVAGVKIPSIGTIERRHKWYGGRAVNRLLRQIVKTGPQYKTVRDAWGLQGHTEPTGPTVDKLSSIYLAHLDKFFANERTALDDLRLASRVPASDEVIDRLFGHHVNTGFDGREDYPSRHDYLAMCDEALALAGLAPMGRLSA